MRKHLEKLLDELEKSVRTEIALSNAKAPGFALSQRIQTGGIRARIIDLFEHPEKFGTDEAECERQMGKAIEGASHGA